MPTTACDSRVNSAPPRIFTSALLEWTGTLSIPPLNPPQPASARPGAAVMKRVVRRLTSWEIDPVVHQINRLRQATLDALEPPDADDPTTDRESRPR